MKNSEFKVLAVTLAAAIASGCSLNDELTVDLFTSTTSSAITIAATQPLPIT